MCSKTTFSSGKSRRSGVITQEVVTTWQTRGWEDAPEQAWVEGIGESLTPLSLPPARYLVLKPPTGLSTPAIFRHPDLKRDRKRAIIEDFVANGSIGGQPKKNASDGVLWLGTNDLQAVACELCPDVAVGLEWFRHNGLEGRMTGSGSALFAPVTDDVDTTTLPSDWISRHCNNLRVHPLFEWR
jgi:4-diphosphocytidyl-2-C-methyl-D-erythritol kinase